MPDTVLMLSGGIDSSVLAHHFVKVQHKKPRAIYFDFGREASRYELASCRAASIALDMPLDVLRLEALDRLMYGSLPIEALLLAEIDAVRSKMTTLPMCKVDNLFPVVMNIAWYYAHGVEAQEVALALTAEQFQEYPQWTSFLDSFCNVLHAYCDQQPKLRFIAPFSTNSKADVIGLATELDVDLAATWSCWRGKEIHDGICGGCRQRKRAFQTAKIDDPTAYENEQEL